MRRSKAGIFRALGHPTLMAVLDYLRYSELSVGKLCQKVEVEQANLSQLLALLRSKHIVETRKDGNRVRKGFLHLTAVLDWHRRHVLSCRLSALASRRSKKLPSWLKNSWME
jgi:DNA-binding transcriptional ArsR family regulator